MRPDDRAWAEALVRFRGVVNPENGLDDDQVEHFRRRLLGSLDELAEQIAEVTAAGRRRPARAADAVGPVPLDPVTACERQVEATTSALVAIDAGVYGICLRCHRPIGLAALSVEPVTRTCRACTGSASARPSGP